MEFQDVRDIAIYGTDCVVDISRGSDETTQFISAKEKYFDIKADNGLLTVTQKSRNIFYRIIMRRFEFKIVLPRSFKGKLRFRNKNGGLYINDAEFSDVELSTANGKFDLCNTSCHSFLLKMSNGSVNVKNMTAAESAAVKCANGNIRFESVKAPQLTISCSNAGLTAIDITSKKFDCSTSNGTIDASAVAADETKLETSNGKINAMFIGNRNDHRLCAETTHGAITIDGVPFKNISDVARTDKRINVKTSNGDIDVRFM